MNYLDNAIFVWYSLCNKNNMRNTAIYEKE